MAKKEQLLTGLAVVQIVLLLILIVQFQSFGKKLGDSPQAPAPSPSPVAAPTPTGPPPTVDVDLDDDPVKGSKSAKVTMVEFSDFQCPFCARFYSQTLPQIQKQYIDTGKLRFVYRDFPLGFHPMAQKAAEASECADEQGKFWAYHDKIFENQPALSPESLKQWAKDIGLNTDKFNDCLDNGKMVAEVQNDVNEGTSYGVRGTPAFFINGQLVSGAQPFSAFQQVIEAEWVK